jgi:hypothetical protein
MSIKKSGKVVTSLLKRKKKPRGKPFEKGHPWRFPKGVSPNPGGRPKKLGESLAVLLAMEDPQTGKLIAQVLGEKMVEDAMNGSAADRREIRLATEGETIHTPDMVQVFMDK